MWWWWWLAVVVWLVINNAGSGYVLCSGGGDGSGLRVGGAVNIFGRFGYLSISMKVVPRNDTTTSNEQNHQQQQQWIFREPIVDVFKQVAVNHRLEMDQHHDGSRSPFQGDFHMEFCDNIQQLLQAYFRDFTIERLDQPWHAFTASWSPTVIARNLGIDPVFSTGQHCYVLVRVAKHCEAASMAGAGSGSPLELQEAVARQVEEVVVGDSTSVGEFIKSFGSHYVASYITGNSLYQVFVYSPSVYKKVKDKLKVGGVSGVGAGELAGYFSPWYAEHTGRIVSASGNRSVEVWATDRLRVHFYFFTYPSLLKLHGDNDLLRRLDRLLTNEALVQLDLRALTAAFHDQHKQQWFNEVVDNYLQLWQANM